MVKKSLSNIKKHGRSIILFLIGNIVGSASFLFLYSQKLDSLYLERDAIYYANNQKYKQIRKLEQELAKLSQHRIPSPNREETIKKIIVEVDSTYRFGAEMIKAQVEAMLEPFLDKSMQLISNNPELVESVLQKKPIPIDAEQTQKVQVHVKYLSFYNETLKIWVKAEENTGEDLTNYQK
ncbi:hypothetical protein [Thermoflavimicrobium dichotomicum]|uniref:Sporulation membrane protein YtrI C-terminal domain-containing protein n=1 Tax=Thermoflavimicrobium dichotomicum TaxID=46223 RepID=A0A1I3LEI1_9BACL|nr:hypothetical protein [Thermoflavimicrobium dichotomicum]SFI82795.1 hypothetical protein SAMN05421852_102145 [Thermoflavimicrobium dichotomicum]